MKCVTAAVVQTRDGFVVCFVCFPLSLSYALTSLFVCRGLLALFLVDHDGKGRHAASIPAVAVAVALLRWCCSGGSGGGSGRDGSGTW